MASLFVVDSCEFADRHNNLEVNLTVGLFFHTAQFRLEGNNIGSKWISNPFDTPTGVELGVRIGIRSCVKNHNPQILSSILNMYHGCSADLFLDIRSSS